MRLRVERALRAAALAALVVLIWRAASPVGAHPPAVTVSSGELDGALVNATRRPVAALALELGSAPGPVHRDWARAVRAAGTNVTWTGTGITPIAISASAVAEPERRVRVSVAAADSVTVVLADGLGAVDTLAIGERAAARTLRTATGSLSAAGGGSRAVALRVVPVEVRRVLVIAAAGWESKFAIAALEEAGWTVDARLRVAPGLETRQGANLSLDTARYSAVVALDGAAAPSAGAIERFVSTGGGAILAGPASRLAALADITPGVAGSRRTAEPRSGFVLTGLKTDAVVLEAEGGGPIVAARRAGRGRVVASGYDESWKWRMRSAPDAPAGHREWWTALVSAVAYAPPLVGTAEPDGTADPAPVAALAARLGAPAEAERAIPGARSLIPPVWLLFGVLLAALLGEVVSRRLRGLA